MTKTDILKNIRTTSMFFLSGILGIIAFFNTAAIEQAKLLEASEDELAALVDGINHSSFNLLLVCIFFFIALLPIEEIITAFLYKSKRQKSEKTIFKFDIFPMITAASFLLGFLFFVGLFIKYILDFIPLL